MIKVHGVNIFPNQIEEVLGIVDGASSEYQVVLDRMNNKDVMTLLVEKEDDADDGALREEITRKFKSRINMTPVVSIVSKGALPRSTKKTKRVIDHRYE